MKYHLTFDSQFLLAVVRVAQSPVPHVQRSLVLLPVVGVGVVSPVDAGVVPHRVDQEVGDCRWGGGGEHSVVILIAGNISVKY